ncbi:uncharacterized protein LOC114355076 [Ostrinia furnacalis]|uniref:uncharacterized protein LOC114355076 n=1 Tax=Ostrinia furnacalis TaxID=93504 RepID=UPI00103C7214|nr:uncharacterized protein LOC114355076 [Ostrinia furnacalis]
MGPPGVQFEDSLLQILPVDKTKCPFVRDNNDVEFRLFTRHNPTVYQELRIDDDESLFASHFNFHDPTVVYFGAFLEQPDDGSGLLVRESYMLRGDSNFIILDLSRLEAGPWYFTAAENTWYIGQFAAKFVDYMVSRGLDLNKTHFIGHSLGAQSAGVAGSALKSGRVSRITGLDPALPLFDKLPLSQRLDPSDAKFVDVIHTDAGIFGFKTPIGHVDFYPNGGISPQPGCELEVVLHEQRFLNKCDKNAQPQGFYVYHLTPNTKKNILEKKLREFFTYINFLKDTENSSPHTESDDEIPKSSPKLAAIRKYKLLQQNNKKNNNKIVESKTEINLDNAQEDTHVFVKENSYKREKRISSNIEVINTNDATNKTTLKDAITTPKDTDTIEQKTTKSAKLQDTTADQNTTNTVKLQDNTMDQNTTKTVELQDNTTLDQMTTETVKLQNTTADQKTTKTVKLPRQKRFISLFRNNDNDSDNLLFRMLEFLMKPRRNFIPVVTVMREINTLVKSANGELNHFSKERNNYIGGYPPVSDIKYDLELGNESKILGLLKRLLGLGPKGGRLSVNGRK